jgi:exodeoxyribonuclease VII small subunit
MIVTQTSEYASYQDAKERLDQIVSDVRGKDISLEESLDLLEEGVALANKCTELIDIASWSKAEQGIVVGDTDNVNPETKIDKG